MRRKTKAKRIPDYEDGEAEEEEPRVDAACHGVQKRWKQTSPAAKDRGPERSPPDTGLLEFSLGACQFEAPTRDLSDAGCTKEEADYLHSYSKMELVTMVLCLQREMESLKEQIRCLTACGKLARNIEALIEKTEVWSNGDRKVSVPVGPSLVRPPMALDGPDPAVLNGHWMKAESGGQKTVDNSSCRHGPFTEFITPELLERCNTGTTAQKLTNDLLRGLYERDCLASHSISGVVYNKRGQPKPALPSEEVQAILRTVQYFFPGKTDAEIKGYIRQKLQNEAKRLRKKPLAPGDQDSCALGLSGSRAGGAGASLPV